MEENNRNKKILYGIIGALLVLLLAFLGLKSCSIGKKDNPMIVAAVQDNLSSPVTYDEKTQRYFNFLKEEDAKGKVTYELLDAKNEEGKAVDYFSMPSNKENKIDVKAGTPAGTYTLRIRVDAAGDKDYKPLSKEITYLYTIDKADTTFRAPIGKSNLTYTGKPQELVTAGSCQYGKMLYKLDDGEWSEEIPQATEAGLYTVYYKVEGDANHKDTKENSILVRIDRQSAGFKPGSSISYGGGFSLPGIFTYIKDNAPDLPSTRRTAVNKPGTYVEYTYDGQAHSNGYNVPSGVIKTGFDVATDAGTYVAIYTPDINHCWSDGTITPIKVTMVIHKKKVGPKPQDVTVVYDGNEHNNGYVVPDGVVFAGLNSGTDAGTYIAIYTPIPNHSWDDGSILPVQVKLTIEKADPSFSFVTKDLIFNGLWQPLVQDVEVKDATIYFSLDNQNFTRIIPLKRNAGEYKVYYKVKGDKNHNDLEGDVDVRILRKTIKMPSTSSTFVYNRLPHTVKIDDYNPIYMVYEKDSVHIATDAGEYKVNIRLLDKENLAWEDGTSETITLTWTIAKAPGKVDKAPIAKDLTYNGEYQQLIEAAVSSTGKMQYKRDESGNYTFLIPTAKNAGTYRVYYYAEGSDNYEASEEAYLDVTIKKAKAVIDVWPEAIIMEYDGQMHDLIIPGESAHGSFYYRLSENEEWSTAIPQGKDKGMYTVYYKFVGDENHLDEEEGYVNPLIEVTKYAQYIDEPEPISDLTYTGEPLLLVTEATTNDGTVYYRVDDGEWTDEIPTAISVGSHTVYSYIKGDEFHLDSEEIGPFTVTIDKAHIEVDMPDQYYVFNGEKQGEPISVKTVDGCEAIVEYRTTFFDYYSPEVPQFSEVRTDLAGKVIPYKVRYMVRAENHVDLVGTYDLTIDKKPYEKPFVSGEAIVYNGEEQSPTLENFDVNAMMIAGTQKAIDAGEYNISIRLLDLHNTKWADDTKDKVDLTWNIERAAIEMVDPMPIEGLVYNGEHQSLLTPGSSDCGTILYSPNGEVYSENIPTAILEGTYPVYYKAVGDKNHIDRAPVRVFVDIAFAKISVESRDQEYIYDGEPHGEGVSNVVTVNDEMYRVFYGTEEGRCYFDAAPKLYEVGEETIFFEIHSPHHETYKGSYKLVIKAAEGQMEEKPIPSEGLVFNGQQQPLLVSGGYTSTGTMVYSVNGSEYREELPTGVNAGDYQISYYSKGDENHTDTPAEEINVHIEKIYVERPLLANFEFTYDGNEHGPGIEGFDASMMKIEGTAVAVDAGEYNLVVSTIDPINVGWADGGEDGTYDWTIYQAPSALIESPYATNPTYNGNDLVLMEGGQASGGSIVYSFDGMEFVETIYGRNAGIYDILYKVKGDENHADSEVFRTSAVINKAVGEIISEPQMIEGLVYNGQPQTLIVPGVSNLDSEGQSYIEYSLDGENFFKEIPVGTDAGDYVIAYRIPESDNYSGSEMGVVYCFIDKAANSAKVTVEDLTIWNDEGTIHGFDLAPYVKAEGEVLYEVFSFDGGMSDAEKCFSFNGSILSNAKDLPRGWYPFGVLISVKGDENHYDGQLPILIQWFVVDETMKQEMVGQPFYTGPKVEVEASAEPITPIEVPADPIVVSEINTNE